MTVLKYIDHINRLKEMIGYVFQKLAKWIPVLRSCANASYLMGRAQVILLQYDETHSRKKVVSASLFVTTERLFSIECVTKLNCRWAYYRVIMWLQFITSSHCYFAQYTPFLTLYPPLQILEYDITCHPWHHHTFKNFLYKKEATKCLICPS